MSLVAAVLLAIASAAPNGATAAASTASTSLALPARPVIGPAEWWVLPAEIPPAPRADGGAATIDLLSDTQVRFATAGDTTYRASVYKIAAAKGLDDGALQLSWDPQVETLTLHRYRILREGKSIDLLTDQSTISVMQRETNLENAALDGRLTVSIQPQDLRIGDVIDLAFSRTLRDPAMGGRSEAVLGPSDGTPYGRVRIRVLWPTTKNITWRTYPGVLRPKLTRTTDGAELVTDLANVNTQRAPQGAPSRFGLVNAVEISEFPDWQTVSRTFAVYYAAATRLAPDSPIKAEAARIADASPDPKSRAELALRLVQNQVRYLFLGRDGGGYVPTSADVTWSRRFGDCKAKTVLLVVLLQALGIEARPVLVNTELGDLVATRLPYMGAFDHAIVEARIGGRNFWLDGTRSGDTRLDWLRTPDYKVGLPLTPDGAGLVRLIPEKLDAPDELTSLTLDARAGIDVPAAATAEMRFRGESAASMRENYTELSKGDQETKLRKLWRNTYDFIQPSIVATRDDPATGDFLLTVTGAAKMDWFKDAGARWYEVDRARLGWKLDIVRDGELSQDAPFAFTYPDWWASRETILLPDGGKGFRLQGDSIDKTIDGLYNFHRTIAIKDGVLTMDADTRALTDEISADKIAQTREQMIALQQQGVFVRLPEDYAQTDRELAALNGDKAALANAQMQRGALRLDRGEIDGAVADEDAVIALNPRLAFAHAVRALSLARKNDAQADVEADRALALDNREVLAWRAKGVLALNQRRWADAARNLSAGLAVNDKDERLLAGRATAQLMLDHPAEALGDLDAALAIAPNLPIRALRARALAGLGRGEEALAEADRAVTTEPQDQSVRGTRLEVRLRFGHRASAREDVDAMIAQKPSAALFAIRAEIWPITDQGHRRADIEAALKLDPRNVLALRIGARDAIDAGNFGGAEADIAAVDALRPGSKDVRGLRTALLVKRGQVPAAIQLLDAAVAHNGKDATLLNERCWLKATTGVQLSTALSDCDAAMSLEPKNAAILDSRAFAKLRLGALDGAIADYDAALQISPTMASSLYGRGIAHMRRGDAEASRADLAHARDLSPDIDVVFSGYGIHASEVSQAARTAR